MGEITKSLRFKTSSPPHIRASIIACELDTRQVLTAYLIALLRNQIQDKGAAIEAPNEFINKMPIYRNKIPATSQEVLSHLTGATAELAAIAFLQEGKLPPALLVSRWRHGIQNLLADRIADQPYSDRTDQALLNAITSTRSLRLMRQVSKAVAFQRPGAAGDGNDTQVEQIPFFSGQMLRMFTEASIGGNFTEIVRTSLPVSAALTPVNSSDKVPSVQRFASFVGGAPPAGFYVEDRGTMRKATQIPSVFLDGGRNRKNFADSLRRINPI